MLVCRVCGVENPEGFRFCGSCGASLAQSSGDEERKVVSVLFVDLVGFTSRADRADPEDVRAILRPYHALLRREIDRWGGTLEKFVGDAAMAVFGAPVAHEDDPERAVLAAFRIVGALADLNEEHGLDLEVRAGVDTGEALVTLGARPSEGEGFVAGDVVNTASRLQAAAPPGGIVVSDATYRATSDSIDYEELEPVALKGKTAPVALWRAMATRSRFGTDLERPMTPFVGREDDLALLQHAYRRALHEHAPLLVTITGEPGVGKTRLVTEFSTWVDDLPEIVFWRQGRCLPYETGVSCWALREIVKAHVGILESDGPIRAEKKLVEAVDAVTDDPADREWLLAALGPLVGVESDRDLSRAESFGAWRTYLEGVASNRPLVLLVDDLHWADDAMLAFLDELLDRSADVPLLVLCTARPELYERHASWGGGKRNSSTVSLSPLSDEETARLLSALLGQSVLDAATQRILLSQAGGNPLYAEEFTKMLVDRGILHRERGTWSMAEGADVSDVPIPESVQAIIAARLDTLPAERKSLLQNAAVVGKVFWSGAVASMGGIDQARVDEVMHELARKELVREARRSSVDGQVEYAFWHALIRDVAYGQIPRVSRIRMHQAAAAWIDRLAGDRIEDVAELLAHHYTSALELARLAGTDETVAEMEEQARRAFSLAGDRVRLLDPVKAEGYYRRALVLTPDGHPEHPRLLVKQLDTSVLGAEETERLFEKAIEGFRARGDLVGAADAMVRFSPQAWQRGEVERALDLERQAVDILRREPPSSELANANSRLSFRLTMSGDAAGGLAAADAALQLGRELDSPMLIQGALQSRGIARQYAGDPGGLEDLREALRMCLELGVVHDTQAAYMNLSDGIWVMDGPGPAIALHREAINHWERRGMGFNDWATGEICWTLFDAGEWDQLMQAAKAVLEFEEQVGDVRQPGAMALAMRSLAMLHRGLVRQATEAIPQILSRVRGNDPQVLIPGLATCAAIAVRRGDLEESRNLAAELAEAIRSRPVITSTWHLTDLARISVSAGVPEITQSLCDSLEIVSTRDRLSMLSAHAALTEAEGRIEEAAAMHADAAGGWHAYGSVPERGFSLLASGRCWLKLGREAQASDALASARAVFARLDARPYLAEIGGLLERSSA